MQIQRRVLNGFCKTKSMFTERETRSCIYMILFATSDLWNRKAYIWCRLTVMVKIKGQFNWHGQTYHSVCPPKPKLVGMKRWDAPTETMMVPDDTNSISCHTGPIQGRASKEGFVGKLWFLKWARRKRGVQPADARGGIDGNASARVFFLLLVFPDEACQGGLGIRPRHASVRVARNKT